MRARGNIYFKSSDNSTFESSYVAVNYVTLYTANELINGANNTDKTRIRSYIATAYCGNGSTPVISSTTNKVIPPTKCIKKDLNSSNLTGDLNVYTFNNDETLFLFYHNFVPTEYNQEVSLCKVLNENNEQQVDVVLIPGVCFKVGGSQLLTYDTVEPSDFVVGINKERISVYCNYSEQYTDHYPIPTNAIIQVNAPAVPLASDWAITHIAVSDSGDLTADKLNKYLVDSLPYEEN